MIYGETGYWDKSIQSVFRHDILTEVTAENATLINDCLIKNTAFADTRLKPDKDNLILFLEQMIRNKWRLFLMDKKLYAYGPAIYNPFKMNDLESLFWHHSCFYILNIIIRIYEKTIFTPCWGNNQSLFNCSSTFDRRYGPRVCGLAGTISCLNPCSILSRNFFLSR